MVVKAKEEPHRRLEGQVDFQWRLDGDEGE